MPTSELQTTDRRTRADRQDLGVFPFGTNSADTARVPKPCLSLAIIDGNGRRRLRSDVQSFASGLPQRRAARFQSQIGLARNVKRVNAHDIELTGRLRLAWFGSPLESK